MSSDRLDIARYVAGFADDHPEFRDVEGPWAVPALLAAVVAARVGAFSAGNYVVTKGVAVHRDAIVEQGAVLKPPVLVMAGAFVAAHAYLRGGVVLGLGARIGPGSEVKSALIGAQSTLAHFNFVGDSILGRDVNLEAGAVVANHFNERDDRTIRVRDGDRQIDTGTDKFGALIGDGCRIGANAVLSPGTLLEPGTIVGRLELVAPALA